MSDEPNQNETPEEWVMPEPVFRTSEGHTPKALPTDEIDTETPDNLPDAGQDMPAISDEIATAITEEMPAYKPAAPKPKGGCFKSVLFVFIAIAIFGAAIIAALIYFLFYFRPADNVTF